MGKTYPVATPMLRSSVPSCTTRSDITCWPPTKKAATATNAIALSGVCGVMDDIAAMNTVCMTVTKRY